MYIYLILHSLFLDCLRNFPLPYDIALLLRYYIEKENKIEPGQLSGSWGNSCLQQQPEQICSHAGVVSGKNVLWVAAVEVRNMYAQHLEEIACAWIRLGERECEVVAVGLFIN